MNEVGDFLPEQHDPVKKANIIMLRALFPRIGALSTKENAMIRVFSLGLLALGGVVAAASPGQAQVFVRAPFVRVFVGPGVSVRAPFVDINIPGRPFIFVPPPSEYIPPQPKIMPNEYIPPQPKIAPKQGTEENIPEAPKSLVENPLTLQAFAKSFQARHGSYQVKIVNPVTKTPTIVRFSLPEGSPRRVIVRENEIEFFYGIRHFVRIQFDEDGALVTSR
jgi:hypothetical protein